MGSGRLHTRLVALFSVIAAVPTVLVAIFASFLFQSGLEFWFSDRARNMLENTVELARSSYDNEVDARRERDRRDERRPRRLSAARCRSTTRASSTRSASTRSISRNLSEAIDLHRRHRRPDPHPRAGQSLRPAARARSITAARSRELARQARRSRSTRPTAIGALTPARLWPVDLPLRLARVRAAVQASRSSRGNDVLTDYRDLLARSRDQPVAVQFRAACRRAGDRRAGDLHRAAPRRPAAAPGRRTGRRRGAGRGGRFFGARPGQQADRRNRHARHRLQPHDRAACRSRPGR